MSERPKEHASKACVGKTTVGSNPTATANVMSQDIVDNWTCVSWVRLLSFVLSGRSGWSSGGLVVAAGVDDQCAQEFAGGGVDDADV